MTLDDMLRLASVPVWLGLLAILAPAVWRLMRRRARYLDPIWGIAFLLVVNRLSFALRISAEVSHASALCLALVMSWFAHWYQRHDCA